MSDPSSALPNAISIARILATPFVFLLALRTSPGALLAAFFLFLAAALSDLWDGYLARRYGWITPLGTLLDPLADKLLLVATLIPFLIVSRRGLEWELPWWGPLPYWVVGVIVGRELFMTVFRGWASRRGHVISAGPAGKYKALAQNCFSGGLLLWYALVRMAPAGGWPAGGGTGAWFAFHRSWIVGTLVLALGLTVYSMGDYLWKYRALLADRR